MTFPSGMVLVDTSAEARAIQAPGLIRDRVTNLALRYLQATCAPVDLELGYTATSQAAYKRIMRARSQTLIQLPMIERIGARALEVQWQLAEVGLHRAAGGLDLLIAATAEVHGAALLHYDSDYDHIASITGQQAEWIVPRGSVP